MKYSCGSVILALFLTACIKDEPKNMECDVLSAWVEGDVLAQYFIRETDMHISDVPSGEEQQIGRASCRERVLESV